MQIDTDVLLLWGASKKIYPKGSVIFEEETEARYYFQVVKGVVKVINLNADGKEFVQGVFQEGCSFGEPPLFIHEHYPSTAIASADCLIIRLPAERFFDILDEYPALMKKFLFLFAKRIYNKSDTARKLMNSTPETRIIGFLDSLKKESGILNERMAIPYTRQEIANFTGLRVETVIRTLSKMNTEKKVEIKSRKLFY